MKSISARLNAVFVGIVTLILLISGGINYFTAKADLDERLAEQAAALSARLKINVPELLWNFDEGQIDKVIEAEMVDVDITGILVSVKGKVVQAACATPTGRSRRPATASSLPARARSWRWSTTTAAR